jgi:hypothetical protein
MAVDDGGKIGIVRFCNKVSGNRETFLGNGRLCEVKEGETARQQG